MPRNSPAVVDDSAADRERLKSILRLAPFRPGRSIPRPASRIGIYTAGRGPDGSLALTRPQHLGVPVRRDGSEVNAKYRTLGEKRFWQRKDARKTFFNADVLDDPALERGDHALVITEGELDALAAIQFGFPFTVSVPDGAPPARDEQGNLVAVPEGADDVAPEHDEKYRYIFNNWPRLEKIKRFILATDGDEPGWRLAQELARRLGRARCAFVTYPQGCKDLNEALEKYGERGVAACFSRAKPFPVKGLYKLSEFPDAGRSRPIRPASAHSIRRVTGTHRTCSSIRAAS